MKNVKNNLILNNLQSQLSLVVMNTSSNICENGLNSGLSNEALNDAVSVHGSLKNDIDVNKVSISSEDVKERVLDKRSEHMQHLIKGQSLLLKTINGLNK